MSEQSISARLIEGAKNWADKQRACDDACHIGHITILENLIKQRDQAKEAFKQLAQYVETEIESHHDTTLYYMRMWKELQEREKLWVALDICYKVWLPDNIYPEDLKQIQKLRQELGLE